MFFKPFNASSLGNIINVYILMLLAVSIIKFAIKYCNIYKLFFQIIQVIGSIFVQYGNLLKYEYIGIRIIQIIY